MSLPEHLADLERQIRARYDAAVAGLRHEYEARLRRASEEMLAGLGEVRTPAFEPLADVDAAAFPPRDAGRDEALRDLLAGARALDAAGGQAAVLDALVDAAHRFAGRIGLLLVREDGMTGWASSGFDGDPFATRELGWDDAWLAPAAAGRGAVRLDAAAARQLTGRLGVATPPASALLVPLVLRDRVAAALYADSGGDGPEPPLAALQLLVQLAAARLELQPLSERDYSPTLYETTEAPGSALPLWSTARPAPEVAAAAPAPVAETFAAAPPAAPAFSEPAPLEVEQEDLPVAPDAALAEPEPPLAAPEEPWAAPVTEPAKRWWEAQETPAEPVPEPPTRWVEPETPVEPVAPTARQQVEALFVAEEPPAAAPEPAPPALAAAPASASEPAPPTPALEDSLWGTATGATDAATAGFAVEPEPALAPPEPAPQAPAPVGDATVRIPAFRPAIASEPAPAFRGITTQQVPEAAPPAPPPSAAPDATEDATVLLGSATAAIPLAPAAPAPPPAAAAPTAPPEEEATERTAIRSAGRTTEVAPPPDVTGPGLAFATGRAVRTTGENALHDEARRLARLLVSEIKLYNEEQVLEGRRNRDLYVRLKEDIDRSRQIYDERVHESVRGTTDYFHQELVRSLAGGDPRALGL